MSHVTRITSHILDFYGDAMDVAAGELLENDEGAGSPRSVMSQRADEPSDEQLMSRLGGPEVEAALSALYDRYSRTVYGVGLKILGDRSLAEELVQDVFLKVWRSLRTFDASRGSFSTWLYRVTRSVAVDLYRKRAHRVLRYLMERHTSSPPGILLPVLRRQWTNPGSPGGSRELWMCSTRRIEK
jgi:hypothetical protein